MHYAVTHKLCIFKPRNHAEYTLLLAPFKVSLETDDIIKRSRSVILPQLHNGISLFAGALVHQPNRF